MFVGDESLLLVGHTWPKKVLDVCRLRKDMQNIIKILRTDVGQEGNVESIGGERKEGAIDDSDEETAEADGLVIITALVTSCIR
jgi:3'-phosphoadenosine 5'-phosphosulfate sulfotransferase